MVKDPDPYMNRFVSNRDKFKNSVKKVFSSYNEGVQEVKRNV